MAKEKYSGFIVSGIGVSPDTDEKEVYAIAAAELKRAGVSPARLRFDIKKCSVDARRKNDIKLVYSVLATLDVPQAIELHAKTKYKISPFLQENIEIVKGTETMSEQPLVVGMGPAGLFCALMLAEQGYRPILIDRGDSVFERKAAYERFVKFGMLDTESNIQFGAGGAGTFSDGKLLTRINDPKIDYVLNRFCDFGAPREILSAAKPHIGTDLLLGIVDKMLASIEQLGGKIMYRTRLESICEMSDGGVIAKTTKGDIKCSVLVLATGHSARDTYKMLLDKGYAVQPKSFSVGVRIEHLRENIDRAMYGDMAGHPRLGKGEYHLSDTSSGRGVYTFCMCPGGEVVAAASEEGGVVVNGMSENARKGKNSNSAVAVSVMPNDYGGTPMGAIEFQRRLERTAYTEGGSDYAAPIMTVGDFLSGRSGSEPTIVQPTYRDGKIKTANFEKIFPSFVTTELKRGLLSFEKNLKGFASPEAVLTGVETRTSAPLRILRGESLCALGKNSIYPCGEGAGYAGGITSSAIDGIKVALGIMERFAPID